MAMSSRGNLLDTIGAIYGHAFLGSVPVLDEEGRRVDGPSSCVCGNWESESFLGYEYEDWKTHVLIEIAKAARV